jgi:hypothetical protein
MNRRPCPPEQRTMFPKNQQRRTPLDADEVEAAREEERGRKKWDPTYVTAEEARSVPKDVLVRDATLRGRIEYSQPDWPENRMSATEALGDLPAGAGEDVEKRPMDAEDLFAGKPVKDEE